MYIIALVIIAVVACAINIFKNVVAKNNVSKD